jgi:hypothetical protein
MSLTDSSVKTPAHLRKFGLTMFGALLVLSAFLFFREHGHWKITAVISAAFLLPAVIRPQVLKPVELVWMKFAGVLGFIMTNLLLGIVFFIAVAPTGILMRLLGKDPIRKGFVPGAESYWINVDEKGPSCRPDKPY